jgi:hypothetical protein
MRTTWTSTPTRCSVNVSDEDVGASVCPACEEWIPDDRLALHLDGMDGARPECARQDLVRIAQEAREASLRPRLSLTGLMSRERLW